MDGFALSSTSIFQHRISSTQNLSELSSSPKTSTALHGRKKGNLGRNVSVAGVSTKKKRGKNKNNDAISKPAKISSSLSEWAATLESKKSGEDAGSIRTAVPSTSAGSSNVASFEPFVKEGDGMKNKSKRRERSAQRTQLRSIQQSEINARLESITELISSNNLSVKDLLSEIKALVQLPSQTTLKSLLTKKKSDYNLAWVGSDDAICHLGTGLHKVPLARLQDIFFTIGRDGSGQAKTVTLMEVIRILGPFPNVRNTLQGSVVDLNRVAGDNGDMVVDKIKVKYDSMMDGLGKEINAGTEDNERFVDLNVLWANDKALVCTVPAENGGPHYFANMGDNGENVLLFLKEDDLDYRLEELRAA